MSHFLVAALQTFGGVVVFLRLILSSCSSFSRIQTSSVSQLHNSVNYTLQTPPPHQLKVATMSDKKVPVSTNNAPKPLPGIYSQAIKAGGFVFVSGATPTVCSLRPPPKKTTFLGFA